MQATKQSKIGKAFSVFVAFALALLMVPIVPGSVQVAAAGDDAGWVVAESENGFAKKLLFDQYGADGANPAVTQTLDDTSKTAMTASLDDPTIATVPDAVQADINTRVAVDAAKAAAPEDGNGLATNDFNSASDKDTVLEEAAKKWISDNPTKNDAAVKAKIAESETGASADDIKLVSDGATFKSVSGGTAVATGVTATDSAITGSATASDYQFNKAASLKLTGAATGDSSTVVAAKTDENSFTLQAGAVSSSPVTVTLTFDYQPAITAYKYSYSGTCTVKYTGVRYAGWKYTQEYKYTVGDDSTEKTATVEVDGGEVLYTLSAEKSVTDATFAVTDAKAEPAAELATGNAAESKTYDFSVSVENLFPDSLDGATNLKPMGFGDTATVEDPFAEIVFATDAAKAHAVDLLRTPSCESDFFSVSQTGASLNVLAKKQTNGETESADVTWSYGGFTAKHTVSAVVAAKVIDMTGFKVDDQTFRLQGDVEAIVLDAANSAVLAKVNAANAAAGLGLVSESYYAAVALTGFDTTGQTDQAPQATWTVADEAAYGNFNIQNMPTSGFVTVKKIREETWPDDLALAANIDLKSAKDAEQWINRKPTASYAGHTLAYDVVEAPAEQGDYASSVALNGGDGTHSNVALYALADNGHEITRVTGVSYRLDTQAPVLLSAEYKTPNGGSTINTGTTLFGKDTVKVELGIVDRVKDNGSEAAKTDAFENVASGLKEQPKVTYRDDKAKADRTPNLAADKSIYSFSLAGNEDVPTDSIKVYAIDNAGNELDWVSATEAENIPVAVLRLVADADAPQLSVSWDNSDVRNGSFYNANRTMTITITEQFFDYIKQYQGSQEIAAIAGSNGTAVVVHPSDFSETSAGSNVWTYRYTFSSDADWTVSNIHVVDLVGHSASASNESFTIDKTTPTMDVVFDNNNASNGNYYNAARTATITVNEHNFNPGLVNIEPTANAGNGDSVGSPDVSGWSSNGDVRTATVYFPGEGVYTLSVSGTDSANNPLPGYTASEFVIDTTTPQIQISGVDNRQAYAGSAQPGVTVQDTNISDATTIELSKISYPMSNDDANPYSESRSNATTEITASYPDASQVVSNDGVYTLTVHAVDMAGNTADQAVTWSVNRFGSTYVLSDATTKMLNNYLQGSKVDNVVVTEINPSGLNESATAVELTHDTSNSTLKLGSDYGISASDSSGWNEYTYNVQKSNFDSDGSYRVLFHSEDVASNTSENTMKNKNASRTATAEVTFAVDDTAPIVSFIDLDSNGLYEENTHAAQVSIEDNLKLDTADVKIDGEKVLELDSAELAKSATHSFDVPESASTHEIVVTAYDAAGNAETVTAANVTVTTDPVKLWMNNTPLFVGTIVGGIVVIGAVVAFFAMRGRRTSL